jgi:hypothetical protein
MALFLTSEVLNNTKDIERKESQKEKRKMQNMNSFQYRDLLQKQCKKKEWIILCWITMSKMFLKAY